MRVLIVDDDAQVLGFFTRCLSGCGHQIATATTFAAGRQCLTDPPDALVVDVRLGGFNGLQLAILARQGNPDIRLVVISGCDDPVIRREAIACGATFLTKPIQLEELLRVLA